MVRKATPRRIRETSKEVASEVREVINLPQQREVPPNQAKKVLRNSIPQTEGRLSLLIVVNTFKRRRTLQRCLDSLKENGPREFEDGIDWRLVVIDDGNSLGRSISLKEMFGDRASLMSPKERLGRGLSKNRALELFRAYSSEEALLLIDDSVVFKHSDLWWRIGKSLKYSAGEVLFFRMRESKSVDKFAGNSYQCGLEEVSPEAILLRRDPLRDLGYVRVRGVFSPDYREYLQSISPNQYLAVPNTLHALQDVEISGEDWESVNEKKRLYEGLSESNDSKPASESHQIPDFDSELRTLQVLGKGGIKKQFNFSGGNSSRKGTLIQKYPGFAETPNGNVNPGITLIIGHRGTVRIVNLLLVLRQMHSLPIRPGIMVVEQDIEPFCQELLEPWIDEYVFAYSKGLYNRGWGFNIGVLRCQSPVVILHDNDLLVPETFIPSIEHNIKKFEAVLTWGSIDYLDPDSSMNPLGKEVVVTRSITNQTIHGGSIAVQRAFFLEIGGFDERLFGWGAEDDVFFLKISRLGKVYQPNKKSGNRLIHLWHSYEIRKNPQGARNYDIFEEYSTKTAGQIRKLVSELGEIGNPLAGRIWGEAPGLINVPRRVEKRLHIVYDVPGWAYYNRAAALKKNAPSGWIVTISGTAPMDLSGVDIVFMLPYGSVKEFQKRLSRTRGRTLLIGAMNVGLGRRMEKFWDLYNRCDHVVVNNREFYDAVIGGASKERLSGISNGVDRQIFAPQMDLTEPGQRVIWTGSVYHAELKGYKLLKGMQEPLRQAGFDLQLNLVDSHGKVKSLREMAEWYRRSFAYIVFSESEGTPNPALECASMGIPVIATKVGNMPELIENGINGYLLEDRNFETLLEKLTLLRENWWSVRENLLEKMVDWDWPIVAKRYFQMFEEVLERNREIRT